MALQTSGTIKLSEIGTEFEDTAPHALTEFYGVDSGIPSSGNIALTDFYGAAASTVIHVNVLSSGISEYHKEGVSIPSSDWTNLSNIDGTYNGKDVDYAYNAADGTFTEDNYARRINLPFEGSSYPIPIGSTIENIYFYWLGAADIGSSAGSVTSRATANMWSHVGTEQQIVDSSVRFYGDGSGPYPIGSSVNFTPSTMGITDAYFISSWNNSYVSYILAGPDNSQTPFPKDPIGLRGYQAYCEITYS